MLSVGTGCATRKHSNIFSVYSETVAIGAFERNCCILNSSIIVSKTKDYTTPTFQNFDIIKLIKIKKDSNFTKKFSRKHQNE